MRNWSPVSLERVTLRKGLLAERAAIVRDVVLPHQWQILNDEIPGIEPSHAIRNLRIAAEDDIGTYYGMVFQDSDVAKWLEAVAYVVSSEKYPELEVAADQVIELLARVQQPDGYLNSYFTAAHPDKRWTNLREDHELYCAGHLIEAAVAYYEATGKTRLLDVVCRLVDHIDSLFGAEPGKTRGYPGHPEIELALVRLFRVTENPRHLELAQYFVEERGRQPHYYEIEAAVRGDDQTRHWGKWGHHYSQAHLPVREQTTAEGHSVRAMYLFSAMTDLAGETGDHQLLEVCRNLWENTVRQRMYITGGIGSQEYGEGFTIDYDLPNDRAYTETCAAIGLVFWASRMLQYDLNREYADIMERALYNGVLSGMSLDGRTFFYVNPLEVWPDVCEARYDHRHVKTIRQDWFTCACCPPNLARLLASIGAYVYGASPNTIYVHLFADSECVLPIKGNQIRLTQSTDYPWDETVSIVVAPERSEEFTVAIRIPGWSKNVSVMINNTPIDISGLDGGYLRLNRVWQSGDEIRMHLPMPVTRIRANPRLRENVGKVALQRGPFVYCVEEIDNGPNLPGIILPKEASLHLEEDPDLEVPVVVGNAFRLKSSGNELYTSEEIELSPMELKAVPYFLWGNRRPGEMLVWLNEG